MAFFSKLGSKLKSLFSIKVIDEEFFDNLEDTLIEGDLGARLTDEVMEKLRSEAKKNKDLTGEELQKRMKDILSEYIYPFEGKLEKGKLNLIMVLGVNGVGKTTTIAKMAKRLERDGYKVLLAAADTFRAAAVEQIDIHAERLGVRIVKQKTGSDPGAVVFDALTSAQSQKDDVVICDTAGRMHNKENLMKELKKIDKIINAKGVDPENYNRFLVIDATTGQNGVSQALLFNEAIPLTGIILTKYDSLSKGGALLQIGKMLKLPIVYVCTGEGYDDISLFDKDEFLNSLVGIK